MIHGQCEGVAQAEHGAGASGVGTVPGSCEDGVEVVGVGVRYAPAAGLYALAAVVRGACVSAAVAVGRVVEDGGVGMSTVPSQPAVSRRDFGVRRRRNTKKPTTLAARSTPAPAKA